WRKPGRYTVKSHAITMSGKVDELMEHSVSVTGERFPEFPGFLQTLESNGEKAALPCDVGVTVPSPQSTRYQTISAPPAGSGLNVKASPV
ncbi:MAG: hypothetical protein U9P12_01335, partial [Verrucomicrobiota bacterium]|nr:hypothetical protein [Verrucomicrobiota bacterium]